MNMEACSAFLPGQGEEGEEEGKEEGRGQAGWGSGHWANYWQCVGLEPGTWAVFGQMSSWR